MKVTNSAINSDSIVTALLGPTNTGKTYRAIEQMLSYESGMIGFPLRLLARENYERVVKAKGRHRVALVTGEEKIIPRQAVYYCCTVESMPVEKDFEFIGVDEVQLAQDPDRGHIFTDRILRARGTEATMFMGSDTMKVMLSSLVPGIEFETCTRFSQLSYTGYKKLTRLPKRTAIVTFSIDDVYNMAEAIRRQRGGTAVVLGALSPRTRNAQVEMYQSGEVDFMVATDAIGMGLNMDISHVALASTRKFDGAKLRGLRNSEIAQIAGRAGRYMTDGTFGVTGRVDDLEPDVVESIQNHSFASVKEIAWRNSALEFASPRELLRSLDAGSQSKLLVKGRPSDDYLTLKALMERDDVMARAQSSAMVRLLWETCQIPDFRQTLSDAHQDLIAEVFKRVTYGPLDEDWVAGQIKRLDDVRGDVDTLMTRIAHIRTWTYISFKSQWLRRAEYWQEKARDIEDKLSDALHQALIRRFVDQRASALMKSLEEGRELLAGVRSNGEVIVESHLIGHLDGFRFIPDKAAAGADYKAVIAAARNVLKSEIKRRIHMITNSKPEQFQLDEMGQILWQEKHGSPLPGTPIAKIRKGDNILKPNLDIQDTEFLQGQDREQIQSFLQNWLDTHTGRVLEPLIKLENEDGVSGTVRGIMFQLHENMGIVPREDLEALIADLDQEDRAALRARRIKLGPILVFLPELNKPAAVRLRALLWALQHEKDLPISVPNDGIVSQQVDVKNIDRNFYQSIGYPVFGPRAIRIDMLDRVISAVYDSADKGKFQAQHKMAEWLGCPIEDLYAVLSAMGHTKIYDPVDEQKDDEAQDEQGEAQKDSGQTDSSEQHVGKTETKPESSKEADKVEDKAKPEEPVKPELATFRLKKGKAFEKKNNAPRHKKFSNAKHKDQGDKKQGKRDKRRNPKGKDYKKQMMQSGPSVRPEDSPFAILQQLKESSDTDNQDDKNDKKKA